mgnify:CR=1 FL=1
MMESKPIVSSFIWKFLERGAAQVFALIVQIVLARLLAPEDFGVLAVLLVFINLSDVLIQKGFATALVQKDHIEDIDINTVFWISELIAAFLYILLFLHRIINAPELNISKSNDKAAELVSPVFAPSVFSVSVFLSGISGCCGASVIHSLFGFVTTSHI